MAKNYYDITLALAGICQSARLVQQLAHQGHCDADALHVSLNSIIDMNPSSTLAVFGGNVHQHPHRNDYSCGHRLRPQLYLQRKVRSTLWATGSTACNASSNTSIYSPKR